MLEAALIAGHLRRGRVGPQPRRAAHARPRRRVRGRAGARGDDLGEPQPVPGQRDQVLRGRRPQAARRDRGARSRPSSTAILADGSAAAVGHRHRRRRAWSRARSTTTWSACSLAVEPDALHGLRVVVDCGNGAAFAAAPAGARPARRRGHRAQRRARRHRTSTTAAARPTRAGSSSRCAAPARTRGSRSTATRTGSSRSTSTVASSTATTSSRSPRSTCRPAAGCVGNAIATTVMANLGLRRALEPHGIDVIETPVGDRHVLAAMEEHDLVLGGEQSGHIIFRDHAVTGDGPLAGILLLEAMVRAGAPLSRARGRRHEVPAGPAQRAGARARGPRRRPTGSGPRCAAVEAELGDRRPRARAAVGHRAGGAGDGRGERRAMPSRPPTASPPPSRPRSAPRHDDRARRARVCCGCGVSTERNKRRRGGGR